jgi:DNA processing protein
VGIVGTRAATPHGLADARELGAVLARAGVTVVSGLAIGIDGAAHEGALDAGGTAIGVVATGLDVVYPRRHEHLHERVRACGLLVSEYRYGTGPHPSRFPVRNRIIAALSDVLVVVEATTTGGARITADQALDYGRELCAYPASRRNPSARGTNEMIRNGAHVVIEPDDVLGVLGLTPGERRAPTGGPATGGSTRDEWAVLLALGGDPATVDDLTGRTGLDPGPIAVAVAGLVRSGHLRRAHGLLWPT